MNKWTKRNLYNTRKKTGSYWQNILGNIPNKVPKFITKKVIEVDEQSGDANNRYKPNN